MKVTDEKSRSRSRIRQSKARGSGSASGTKCHGSGTLVLKASKAQAAFSYLFLSNMLCIVWSMYHTYHLCTVGIRVTFFFISPNFAYYFCIQKSILQVLCLISLCCQAGVQKGRPLPHPLLPDAGQFGQLGHLLARVRAPGGESSPFYAAFARSHFRAQISRDFQGPPPSNAPRNGSCPPQKTAPYWHLSYGCSKYGPSEIISKLLHLKMPRHKKWI